MLGAVLFALQSCLSRPCLDLSALSRGPVPGLGGSVNSNKALHVYTYGGLDDVC